MYISGSGYLSSILVYILIEFFFPVFFEPTDIAICTRPFETPYWPVIKYISPNLSELKKIAKCLKISTTNVWSNPIEEAAHLGTKLLEFLDNIIVTLGPDGILIVKRSLTTDRSKISIRHYPTEQIKDFINVSGAGDCFASGLIAGLVAQEPEEICVSIGFASAKKALYSSAAVPREIFDRSHIAWRTPAIYKTM